MVECRQGKRTLERGRISGLSALMEPMRMIDSDDMLLEQVEQALAMTPEERFRAGGELFDAGCRFALMGIRSNFPGAGEAECLERLRQRLAWADELYEPVRP
jgi:hypothetical protein